jgi:hypothetical protein
MTGGEVSKGGGTSEHAKRWKMKRARSLGVALHPGYGSLSLAIEVCWAL